MVESCAENRARDAQIELNTEEKTREAVEADGRSARAQSEKRRCLYGEELERRLRDELRQEVRQETAAAAVGLAETQAESGFRQESVVSRGLLEVPPRDRCLWLLRP